MFTSKMPVLSTREHIFLAYLRLLLMTGTIAASLTIYDLIQRRKSFLLIPLCYLINAALLLATCLWAKRCGRPHTTRAEWNAARDKALTRGQWLSLTGLSLVP